MGNITENDTIPSIQWSQTKADKVDLNRSLLYSLPGGVGAALGDGVVSTVNENALAWFQTENYDRGVQAKEPVNFLQTTCRESYDRLLDIKGFEEASVH